MGMDVLLDLRVVKNGGESKIDCRCSMDNQFGNRMMGDGYIVGGILIVYNYL